LSATKTDKRPAISTQIDAFRETSHLQSAMGYVVIIGDWYVDRSG
jgi:hypothetical protein